MSGFEYLCQRQTVTQFEDVGSIELRKKRPRLRKPAWLVLTKLVGLVGVIILGLILIPDEIPFVTGEHAIAATLIVIGVYSLVAHFVHPRANMDNLGIAGIADDKFQYYDDINRNLLMMDVALGPGRFIASTVIDACTLAGLLTEKTQADLDEAEFSKAEKKRSSREEQINARVAAQRTAKGIHTVELDSAKYFSNTTTNNTTADNEDTMDEVEKSCSAS